jgi:hypothetical protein
MNFKKQVAGSMGMLAVITTFAIGTPSYSADYNLTTTLNTTNANLEAMIASGAATGKLTASQAASFRAQLAGISQMQASFNADGNFNSNELSQLMQRYTTLTSQVNTAVTSGNPNIGVDLGGGYGGGFFGRNTDLVTAAADFEMKVAQNLYSGRITAASAQNLRDQLALVRQRQITFEADGRLNRDEASQLRTQYASLNTQLTALASAPGGRGGRWGGGRRDVSEFTATGANIEAQIATNLASGRISPATAASLRAQLATVRRSQAAYLNNGTIGVNEANSLRTAYANLSTQVNTAIAAGTGGRGGGWGRGGGYGGGGSGGIYGAGYVDQLQAQMNVKINTGVSSRLLTRNEARNLQNQMEVIASQEARLRTGGLNSRERMTLIKRLQDLSAKIDRDLADNQTAGRGRGGRYY